MGVIPWLRPRLCQRWLAETAGGGRSGPGKEDADEVLQRQRPARRQVRGEPRFGSPSHGLQGPVERTNNCHGLRSLAANLARRIGAPNLTLIYESDTIGAKPLPPPPSIGDGELANPAVGVVSVPEIFAYWLQSGRIELGFLGAAQIYRFAGLNTTVVGHYQSPSVRLPGAGGALEIAACCQEVILVMRHSRRAFVKELDFVTSVGHRRGRGDRERLGFLGRGPTAVITDLGVLRPDPLTLELTLTAVHPGVDASDVSKATSWDWPSLGALIRLSPA